MFKNSAFEQVEQNVILPGNTKGRISASKYWCFTLNNFNSTDVDEITTCFTLNNIQFIYGKEIGLQGTHHLQGYIESEKEIRPMEYLKLNKAIHWEKRCKKGSRAHNIKYCTKEGDYYTNMLDVPQCIPAPPPFGWQLDVITKAKSSPSNRDIFWYWSWEGGKGKSSIVRYMVSQGAIVCAGKASDMKYQICQYINKHGYGPKIVIFDVPRSAANYLSYSGLEEIKNGCFASNKYESDMCLFSHPHVFVFCNFPPDLEDKDLSSDRIVEFDIMEYLKDEILYNVSEDLLGGL